MNELHVLFAGDMLQSGIHETLEQAPFADICLAFSHDFFDLFEPAEGWPMPLPLPGNSCRFTDNDMYYLASKLSQNNVITKDVENSISKIVEFSDINRYSSKYSSSGNGDYNPYRYRRIVVDSIYEVCDVLKTKVIFTYVY